MSKWKNHTITIRQIIADGEYGFKIYGLGDDDRVYEWNKKEGGWEKLWFEKDGPNE